MNLESLTDEELIKFYLEKKNEVIIANGTQMAKKTILNSAYGAFINNWFLFNDTDVGESITLSGQLSVKWVERDFNKFLNKSLKTENKDYVIAIDTDSMYVNCELVIEQAFSNEDVEVDKIVDFLDRLGKNEFQDVINKSLDNLCEVLNSRKGVLNMKREAIAKQGIWTAKKKYLIELLDDEGVRLSEPKLKMVGIQAIQSSTPELCRDNIRNCIRIIFEDDEPKLHKYIEDFRKVFYTKSFNEIAKISSANELEKWQDPVTLYKKRCPIHTRGALAYNRLIDEKNLGFKHEKIYSGDKVRYCYMKMPNIARENILSVPNQLPREFELEEYIDYQTQFQKAFLQPLNNILKVINWSTERKATLAGLF